MHETEAHTDPLDEGVRAFAALVRGPDAEIDLAQAALALGRIEQPSLDPAPYLKMLEALATRVSEGIAATSPGGNAPPETIAEQVVQVLFDREGFHGDGEDYYHPLNGHLHALLERRLGMPIILAILFIEVARRVGLEVHGVGAPGHFFVKYEGATDDHFLDPFSAGAEVPVDSLRERIREALTESTMSPEALLDSVTKRQILSRVLTNLKGCYARRQDLEGALGAVNYTLAMTPWALDAIRDRGFLLYALQRYDESLQSLRQYRDHAPGAGDLTRVERLIRQIEA
jgi:regulator of sirC expression with transglutaminase-like and TPR domain